MGQVSLWPPQAEATRRKSASTATPGAVRSPWLASGAAATTRVMASLSKYVWNSLADCVHQDHCLLKQSARQCQRPKASMALVNDDIIGESD